METYEFGALLLLVLVGLLLWFLSSRISAGLRGLASGVAALFTGNGRPMPGPNEKDAPPEGNQRILPEEYLEHPVDRGVFAFAYASEPATPFEDFNRKLLVIESDQRNSWPERQVRNDYATVIHGDLPWIRQELRTRLRPIYPTILDSFGWWAEASRTLELNPLASSPVINAYLSIPIESRPVIISRIRREDAKDGDKLEFFRFWFEDFELDRRFLADHPAELLRNAMMAFTGTPEEWWRFSPARLRKQVIDALAAKSRIAAAREDMAQALRRAASKNRFAALWGLEAETAEPDGVDK